MEIENGKGIFKRIIAVLMAVILLLCVAPLEGVAQLDFSAFNLKAGAATELAATGNCGENVTWSFDSETGTLTISGTGAMADYEWGTSPFHVNDVKDVIIESGVTSIGSCVFYDCRSITSVTIGNSVTSIGSFAFKDCSNIEKVYITDIEAWCNISFSSYLLDYCTTPLFYGADIYLNGELLTEVVIPDTITRIGKYAFYGSTSIEEITIPFSVKTIDSYTFPSSLKNVMIYSKDCTFASDCGLSYKQTIYGFKGSTAEKFAEEIAATFIDIETVHSHEEEIISAKPASCTEKGLTDGKKCSVCGKVTVEQKETPVISHTLTTLKAVKPTYTKTGLTEGKKCKVCGKVTVKQKKVAKKKLKKVTISSVKSTKKATALVTWKKVTDASGYIVEYSTSKKFTKKTTKTVKIKKGKITKTTLKKLKSGKKYYVRIKAYKTVNKKTVYGAYSSVKSVKIK